MTTSTSTNGRGMQQGELPRPLYAELHRIARARLAAGGRHTLLDSTVLVHEAYLRLRRSGQLGEIGRDQFLAYAAVTMRSVIVDFVRRRRAQRRGGEAARVTLDTSAVDAAGAAVVDDDEVLEVHDALARLGAIDPRLERVVEMRYFGGFSDAEIAEALGVTDRTVRRDWDRARLLLAGMLGR